MAPVVSMRQLLEAGVHFGHQTRRWDPKMDRYIWGERNGIHIFDLQQTLSGINESYTFIRDLVADGGTVLFVGTKKQAQDGIAAYARRCAMPYVNQRWLGGMMTNFKTVKQSIKRLKELESMAEDGSFDRLSKKEALGLKRESVKLNRSLGGIKDMSSLPDALFVVDVGHENIAVNEARKLGIPVVAVVDTNCAPELVDYVIPGNDDAMRAIALYAAGVAEAVLDGKALVPEVQAGEDEFVELDEDGKPRKKSGARKKAPARKRAKPAAKPAARAAAPAADKPAEAADADAAPAEASAADEAPAAEAAAHSDAPVADAPAADAPAADAPADADDAPATKE